MLRFLEAPARASASDAVAEMPFCHAIQEPPTKRLIGMASCAAGAKNITAFALFLRQIATSPPSDAETPTGNVPDVDPSYLYIPDGISLASRFAMSGAFPVTPSP